MKKLFIILLSIGINFQVAFAKGGHQATSTDAVDTTKALFQSGAYCAILDSNANELKITPWTVMLKIFPELKANGQWGERLVLNSSIIIEELEISGQLKVAIKINGSRFGQFDIVVTDLISNATFQSHQFIEFGPTRHGQLVHFAPQFQTESLYGLAVHCLRN